ncbi:hypothetical protein ACF0H5_014576 [Mactra antiquata]
MASRNYPANTQIQKFLEESYNKERDVRLSWHGKAKNSQSSLGKSKQLEVFKRKIENDSKPADGLLSKVPKGVKEPRYNKKIIGINDTLAGKESSEVLSAEMRPVTPHTKEKLYDGFTKEGKGRYQYLLERYERNPEEKFSFPLLSSWEYGWRLGDVIKKADIKKPPYGRTRIVADTFYTRTGIPGIPTGLH